MARKLIVEIVGDSSSLEKSFDRSAKATKNFDRQMGQTTRGAIAGSLAFKSLGRSVAFASAPFLGGAGIVAALKSSVDAASNLNEQTTKSQQIFKGSSKAIEAWGQTTASSFGIANDQALAATGTFGNLFRTVGLAPAAASRMSRSLVELAADLASFNNASPEEALEAIRSGLIGEAEPLRRFGVLLSEARVQQEAMAETGKKSAKELTNQEKALARYRIILNDTLPAQGDFARTSEGLANQQRILSAELRDLSADLGKLAIPALTAFIGEMREGIQTAHDFGDALGLIPFDKIPHRGDTADFFAGFKDGFKNTIAPGVVLFETLRDRIIDVREEASKPFNFSALDALTKGQKKTGPVFGVATPQTVLTPEQRRAFFDAKIGRELDRVQDIASARGRIASLRSIQDELKAKLAITKDATRRLNLEDQILQITRLIKGEQQGIAAASKAATDAANDRAKAAREAAAAAAKERAALAATARETKQFRVLGLGPGGAELIPNEGQLRRRVEAMGRKGGVVTKKIRNLLGDSFKGLSEDVRRTIDDMLDQIDDALKKHTDGAPIAAFRKKSANELLAGLGLSADEIRAVRNRLAGVGIGGASLAPSRGIGAFGVLVNVDLDGEQVTKKVTIRQQKQRARNPAQKRGSGRDLVR